MRQKPEFLERRRQVQQDSPLVQIQASVDKLCQSTAHDETGGCLRVDSFDTDETKYIGCSKNEKTKHK